MNSRHCYPTIVGSCIAAFAACVFAQAPATSAAVSASGAAQATEHPPAAQTSAPAKMHHAKKHKAMHSARTNESMANPQDAAYRTALRQCVEGQASQRDQCLDDAIARYGRS